VLNIWEESLLLLQNSNMGS